jgi:hypothetical protein
MDLVEYLVDLGLDLFHDLRAATYPFDLVVL